MPFPFMAHIRKFFVADETEFAIPDQVGNGKRDIIHQTPDQKRGSVTSAIVPPKTHSSF